MFSVRLTSTASPSTFQRQAACLIGLGPLGVGAMARLAKSLCKRLKGTSQMKFDVKRLLTLDKCTALVTIIGLPFLLLSLWFARQLDKQVSDQIGELKKVADAQLKIAKSQNNIGLTQSWEEH
jgi:hypothetical protein